MFEMLQIIVKPIMLRRTKQSKDKNGKSILNLPNKTIECHHLVAVDEEREIYCLMEQKSQKEFNGLLSKNILYAKYMQVLELILRLR